MKIIAVLFSFFWVFVLFLSFEFQHYHFREERPIVLFVGLWVAMFILLGLVGFKKFKQSMNMNWKHIVLCGLFFRLLMVFSNPIQEDDFYRYLWDGAVLSEGLNPFKYSPQEVQKVSQGFKISLDRLREQQKKGEYPFSESPEEIQQELKRLALLSEGLKISELQYDDRWQKARDIKILSRVNYPEVPTIYPPVAQGVFALSAKVNAGNLWTLRLFFVLAECLTMWLLVKILLLLKKDPSRVFWYAWNPLVIKEFVNSPHLDVLMVTAMAGCLYYWLRSERWKSAMLLAVGVAAKIFVAPLGLFFLWWHKKKALGPVVVSLLLVILSFMCFSSAGSRQWQGFKTMASTSWVRHSLAVELLEPRVASVIEAKGQDPYEDLDGYVPYHIFDIDDDHHKTYLAAQWLRRVLSVLALCWLALCLWRSRHLQDKEHQLQIMALCLTGLLLLSPVVNPWYVGILMFFLPFIRWKIFMLTLGTMMGLYYLSFHFNYQGMENKRELFRWVIFAEGMVLFLAFLCERWILFKARIGGSDGSN